AHLPRRPLSASGAPPPLRRLPTTTGPSDSEGPSPSSTEIECAAARRGSIVPAAGGFHLVESGLNLLRGRLRVPPLPDDQPGGHLRQAQRGESVCPGCQGERHHRDDRVARAGDVEDLPP